MPGENGGTAEAHGPIVACTRMSQEKKLDAFHLLSAFLRGDEHYRASSEAYGDLGDAATARALDLFLNKPELGVVWLA